MELVVQATETADGKTYDYVIRISGAANAVAVLTSTRTEVVVANVSPTADAGPDQPSVASGATVTLDGSGSSDSDGSVSSYAWTRTGGTGGSIALSSSTAQKPTFTADTLISIDAAVTHIFSLVVTDDGGASSTADTVTITVNPPANAGPTADAGPDQPGIASGATVTLDGSGSSDSDGSIASYAWTETTSTGVTLSDATAAMPTFTAPTVNPGDPDVTITFDLVVTDDGGASSTADSVDIVTGPLHATVAATQGQIADAAQTQANNIMNTMPSFGGFLGGGGGLSTRSYNLYATDGNFNLNFEGSLLGQSSKNYAGKYDIWAKVLAVHSDAGTSSSDFFVGYLGTHRFVNENFLIGAMAQVDYSSASESVVGSSASGRGFMVGPYMAGKIANTNMEFEGAATWGRSYNNITPIGTYTDNYSTERWMVMGKVAGSFNRGAWTISPNASLSYFSQTQAAYVDTLAALIPSQTTTLGEIKLGPSFSRDYNAASGNIMHGTFGVSAVTNFAISSSSGSQAFPLGNGAVRGRLDAGVSTTTNNGWNWSASGFYDGIGINNYRSFGGTITADIKF